MRRCVRALSALVVLSSACEPADETVPTTTHDLSHVAAPIHCWTSVHARDLYPLADGALAVAFRPTDAVSMANLTLVTRDEGRTFERPVGDIQRPLGVPRRAPLAASLGVFPLPGGGYVSLSGLVGTSRLPGANDTFTDFDWLLVAGPDGEITDHLVNGEPLTLPNGDAAQRVWDISAELSVASAGVWLYASRDAGATWQVIGWNALTLDPYPGVARLETRHARLDRAIVEDPLTRRFFVVEPGRTPTPLFVSNASGAQPRAADVALFEDGVVFLKLPVNATGARIPGAPVELVVASLDGATTQSWTYPSDLTTDVAYAAGDDGTLWLLPRGPSEGGDAVAIVRLRPGADPERLDLDLGAATMDGVLAAVPRADGRLLLSVRTRPERDERGTRYFGSALFCELGPGVAQSIEPLVVEPVAAAAAAPGEVVRVARVGEGTTVSDRFVRTASGRVYATYGDQVRIGPPDVAPLLAPGTVADANGQPITDALRPDAVFAASDDALSTVVWTPSQLTVDPPATQLLTFDLATGLVSDRAAFPFGNEQVYEVQEAFGLRFMCTDRGCYSESELHAHADPDDRAKLPRGTIFGAAGGVAFDDGYAATDGVRAYDAPVYLRRFDPLSGRMVDPYACQLEDAPPADCLAVDDADLVAAQVDVDGATYALDFRYGRVLRLPTGSDTWETIARGFVTPSDLRLAHHDGDTVVLVYDGDIYGFRPAPGVVAVRGVRQPAAPSAAAVLADSGIRDHRGCLPAGPCASVRALAGSGALCIPGGGFGASGTLELDGASIATTAWSDAEVCVDAATLPPRDGLLTVVTAAGARSAPIAWHAPRAIDGWSFPDRVTPLTPITVTGKNLRDGAGVTVQGAALRSATDTTLTLLAPRSGLITIALDGAPAGEHAVTVDPVVVQPCHAGPAEPCEVVALGLDVVRGAVTIDGQAATIDRWAPPFLRVSWPEGLAPGAHTLTISGLDGATGSAEVVLGEAADTLLVADGTLDRVLDTKNGPPVSTALGLLVGASQYQQYTPVPALVGVGPDGEALRGGLPGALGANAIHLLAVGEETYAFTYADNGHSAFRVEAGAPGQLGATRVGQVGGPGGLVAVGVVDGAVIAVKNDTLVGMTHVLELDLAGASGGQVPTRDVGDTPGVFGIAAGTELDQVAHGAWVTADGVYLGECRNLTKGAELYFTPIARVDEASPLVTFGRETLASAPDARLLACAPTPDGAFSWVQREADGRERLMTWAPPVGPVTEVAVLPPTLPGVGQTTGDGVPGVLDVIAGEGGDWLLLLADREGPAPALRVVRWDATAATWREGAPFGDAMAWEPGELCVGPLAPGDCDEPLGSRGCAPLACPVRPLGTSRRASNHATDGWLVPTGAGAVDVVYELRNTRRTPGFVLGGVEARHARVPIP